MKTLHLVSVWRSNNLQKSVSDPKRQFLVGNNINVSAVVKAIFTQICDGQDLTLERASDNNQFPLLYTIGKNVTVSGWLTTYTERQTQWHIQVDTLPAAPHIKVTANAKEELESLVRCIEQTFVKQTVIDSKALELTSGQSEISK